MHKKMTLLWLLVGLGSKLQIVASLSITELIVLLMAPYIYFTDYRQMMRDGVMPFFVFSLLVIFGCCIASITNATPPAAVLRGFAATSIVSCSIIFSHWILRKDPAGFKWFVLTLPVSLILSTFFLRQSVEVSMYGNSTEEIMNGPIFWVSRLQNFLLAPIKGWYLKTPLVYSLIVPVVLVLFSMVTTTSGRSAALSAIGFVALVLIGGKNYKSMRRIPRNFGLICVIGIVGVLSVYNTYKFAASHNLLGVQAQIKYEQQSSGGQGGIIRLLLGGRGASFVGLLACRDKPIVGWGPWARDMDGYTEEFIEKYGTIEDRIDLYKAQVYGAKIGITGGDRLIACHSYVTEFWLWYGIFGLIFWVYVCFVLLRYLKHDVASVPQWFAWLACSIPGMFWGIFFSPFADRFGVALFVVACLMARAVRKGTFRLPYEMVIEIENADNK